MTQWPKFITILLCPISKKCRTQCSSNNASIALCPDHCRLLNCPLKVEGKLQCYSPVTEIISFAEKEGTVLFCPDCATCLTFNGCNLRCMDLCFSLETTARAAPASTITRKNFVIFRYDTCPHNVSAGTEFQFALLRTTVKLRSLFFLAIWHKSPSAHCIYMTCLIL